MANNDNSSCASYIGCFISLIITFLMIGGVGYCTYKEHYYDYPAEIADAINDHDFERAHELLVEMKDNHRYQSHWFNNEGYEAYLATYNKLMQAEINKTKANNLSIGNTHFSTFFILIPSRLR